MERCVTCLGEPRDPQRVHLLERFARSLVPALDGAHGGIRVRTNRTLVLGDPLPGADAIVAALAPDDGPFLIRRGAACIYAATPAAAAEAARSMHETAGATSAHDAYVRPLHAPSRGDRRYPTLSGELDTLNPYPVSYLDPADGVCRVVLGLGDDLATRADALRFSPRHPDVMPDFSQVADILRNGQKSFRALSGGVVTEHPLSDARADGTLQAVGGIVSLEDQMVYPGARRPGVAIVTCAMLLKDHPVPFAPLLRAIVEQLGIAPADGKPAGIHRVGFSFDLPTPGGDGEPLLVIDDLTRLPDLAAPDHPSPGHVLLATNTALGHGTYMGTEDVLYVPPDRFDAGKTREIAAEIAAFDAACEAQGRRYVLIVPGRLGSTDRSLGVPVTWRDIRHASVLVEVALDTFNVEESLGTHFFRELTTEGTGYLHVSLAQPGAEMNWPRLAAHPAVHEGAFVRAIRPTNALRIRIDAGARRGSISL